MRAMVTGAGGFIGGHLVAELARLGWEVAALRSPGSEVDDIDVREPGEVTRAFEDFGPDTVFHLAGVSGPMVLADRPAEVAEVNCVGTVNVVEAARAVGARRLVYAASVSGYEAGTAAAPFPRTVYGATKRFGEVIAGGYGLVDGRTAVSAVIGSVYGPGRQTVDTLGAMIEEARASGTVSFTDGPPVPLVHVRDCARYLAALGAIDTDRPGYDLVTQALVPRRLAEMVAAELRVTAVHRPEPERAAAPRPFTLEPLREATGLDPSHLLPDALPELVAATPRPTGKIPPHVGHTIGVGIGQPG